jgi:hypothetical protein
VYDETDSKPARSALMTKNVRMIFSLRLNVTPDRAFPALSTIIRSFAAPPRPRGAVDLE